MVIRRKEIMDLSVITDKIIDFTKEVGKNIIEEITNYMDNQQLTSDSKVELQNRTRDMLKEYDGIYEVKNRVVYKHTKDSQLPVLVKNLYNGQENGYYTLNNNSLVYNQELNEQINQKINQIKKEVIEEQNRYLNSCRIDGEEYIVDEVGDDEKYIYLTRKSDNMEFQDINISNQLYEKLKEELKSKKEPTLIWNGKEYIIK